METGPPAGDSTEATNGVPEVASGAVAKTFPAVTVMPTVTSSGAWSRSVAVKTKLSDSVPVEGVYLTLDPVRIWSVPPVGKLWSP
jgi:hypothetical protein